MQKLAYRLVAIAVFAFSSIAAKADTLSTFSLNDVTISGSLWSATGTFTFDKTTGFFSDLNVVVSDSSSSFNFQGVGIGFGAPDTAVLYPPITFHPAKAWSSAQRTDPCSSLPPDSRSRHISSTPRVAKKRCCCYRS